MEKAHTPNKVLVIGIDGGTFEIIAPMVKQGKLPNIEKLMTGGFHGTLMSTIPPVTAPAWSSFITGTNPGQHGVYYFFKDQMVGSNTENKQKALVTLRDIKGIPFWRVLNKNGKKVGLINIPLTYPPDNVNPFMISGMFAPKGAKDYTYPEDLSNALENYCVDIDGLMDQGKWHGKKLVKENRQLFIDNVYQMTHARAHNALKLMKQNQWDLFMVVFTGSDRICHFFWQDHQNQATPSKTVSDYYHTLDRHIGALVDAAGAKAVTIIMSDHGFGPAPRKKINLVHLMRMVGGTRFVPNFRLRFIKHRLVEKLTRAGAIPPQDFVDPKRSEILMSPIYANFLGVSINPSLNRSLDKQPNMQSTSLKEDIRKRFEALVDPENGRPLVKNIYFRDEVYSGPYTDQAPDLTIQFSYDYKMSFAPLKNNLVLKHQDIIRTGEHRREGLFISSGPPIAKGPTMNKMCIQDVTPTILHLLNVPIPQSYDGRLLSEIFKKDCLAEHKPRYCTDDAYRKDDHERIMRKADYQEDIRAQELLKNLGYM